MCICQSEIPTGEDTAQRLLDYLNGAAASLMISVGHRTRLFDTMADLPPTTSGEIAEAAGLNERYVREWLSSMVTARLVQYFPENRTFHLAPSAAALLTRRSSPNNMAATAQFIPILGGVESEIVECFARGGGVDYASYQRFHQVMAEESSQTVVSGLLSAIIPLVPGLEKRLQSGIQVLDVGCGSGKALRTLAQQFPASRFVGYDLCPEALTVARQEAVGLTNLSFEVADASAMNVQGQFDLVVAFDSIHDQAHPDRVLRGIRRGLREEGVFLMQDIRSSSRLENNLDHPMGTFLYTISCLHCMSVSLAQGGMGLGAAWGEELAIQMLREAGFGSVEVSQLEHDSLNSYYVCS